MAGGPLVTDSCQLLMRSVLLSALLLVASSALAEQQLILDPESARVDFHFRATLHDVNGSLEVSSGSLRFDSETGAASGRFVLDARSATTDNPRRDAKMHAELLDSERHPEIVFVARHVEVEERTPTSVQLTLSGELELYGATRAIAIPASVAIDGERVDIDAQFVIDYTEWGVPNVGNFVMRIADLVSIRVQARGRLARVSGASR